MRFVLYVPSLATKGVLSVPWGYVKKPAPICPGCGKQTIMLTTDQYWCDDCRMEMSYKKRPPNMLNVYGVLKDGSRKLIGTTRAVTGA